MGSVLNKCHSSLCEVEAPSSERVSSTKEALRDEQLFVTLERALQLQ